MQQPRIASRYAKSLIDLSIEMGQLEQVYADMQWLQAVCKSSREFVNLLRSPIIHNDTKRKIITAVAAGNTGDLTLRFVMLLITKNRESNLPEIIQAFMTQYKVHKNIQTVKLTTAVPVSDDVRSAIIAQVKKTANCEKVEVEEKVDPAIVGGFVLQVGDKLVDASIAYDLKEIARQFENNDFIYRIR